MKQYDIVIIITPFISLQLYVNVALLKPYIEKCGFSCKIIDWNYKLYQTYDDLDFRQWLEISLKYIDLVDSITPYGIEKLNKVVPSFVDEIKQYNPKWIGLSMNSLRFSRCLDDYLIPPIKKEFPNTKIIAGGNAIALTLDKINYGKTLVDRELVDYVVTGEGEESIVQILKDETWENFKPIKRIKNLDDFPDPDYSYFKSPIPAPNLQIPIITSRGCTKKCSFCVDPYHGVYKRNPKRIVDEIINLCNIYKGTSVIFNQPLVNADSIHLMNICDLIIENKNKLPDNFRWYAFMCCFQKRKNDELLYKKIKESGGFYFMIGVESGSEKVRNSMNKKTSNEDILFMMSQFKINKMIFVFQALVGYYTEEEDDFQQTIDFIKESHDILKEYLIVDIGFTFTIYDIKFWEKFGVKDDGKGSWYYKDNTFPVRVKRWIELYKFCKNNNIKTSSYFHLPTYIQIQKYKEYKDLEIDLNILRKDCETISYKTRKNFNPLKREGV